MSIFLKHTVLRFFKGYGCAATTYICYPDYGIKDIYPRDYARLNNMPVAVQLVSQNTIDSDFFQLINDKVKVIRYRGEKTIICDDNYIKEKFDVLPYQYADFKSLTGDNSDNIKGAEK